LIAAQLIGGCKKQDEQAGAGAPARATSSQLTVGFSQIGAESGWRTAETQSIRSEADKRGVNLKFADAQQKQENQIKAIRTFIAQNVNAIILAPVVETGWEPVLKEAKRANIPVILVDRGVSVSDDPLYTTLIASTSSRKAAWPAAGWRKRSTTRPTSSNFRNRRRRAGDRSAEGVHGDRRSAPGHEGDQVTVR
jgi:simple sugar transport system substrate-binding protein